MDKSLTLSRRKLPAVDELLRLPATIEAIEQFGRPAVTEAIRDTIATARASGDDGGGSEKLADAAIARLTDQAKLNLKAVFNLTGTVLHTNLGRAQLAEAAIEAATTAMRHAVTLEFNLDGAHRGERDDLLRDLLRRLTGAEDATVVNNNAAAVLLALNTFAKGRETIVSRGELIEIGGAFRLPEIMGRAGTKLHEVGTTNRTHLRDYVDAIGPRSGLILKVHTSNYIIQGFTKEVATRDLAALARAHDLPLMHDLGSGTLIDLSFYGFAHEPTVAETVAQGADLVAFSGDKLFGGPQAGFIVGRAELIARINRNPMKRALRVDKIRLAAIEATLRLYRDPDRLRERLPVLRLLTRPQREILASAERLQAVLQTVLAARLGDKFSVEAAVCESQVGSGAVPLQTVASAGLFIKPKARRGGRTLTKLASALRQLPIPVIGRIENQTLILDLRCLDDEAAFIANFATLGEQPDALD